MLPNVIEATGIKLTETEPFKLKDIGFGLVVPILVGLLIIAFPTILRPGAIGIFTDQSPIPHIISFGFGQMLIFGIPVVLGLVWNKWAGGAAGFLTGSLWYLAMAGYSTLTYLEYGMTVNFFKDASLIMYIVVGVLIGYIAGALNNGSTSFKRMLGASLTAAITTGLMQFFVNYQFAIPENRAMTLGNPLYAFFLVMLPTVILGIIVPVVAKVMTWYGLQPLRH
jgi:uncharacterized membrane protein YeaQ/YmgE (transglycosylase-associated protein family)